VCLRSTGSTGAHTTHAQLEGTSAPAAQTGWLCVEVLEILVIRQVVEKVQKESLRKQGNS